MPASTITTNGVSSTSAWSNAWCYWGRKGRCRLSNHQQAATTSLRCCQRKRWRRSRSQWPTSAARGVRRPYQEPSSQPSLLCISLSRQAGIQCRQLQHRFRGYICRRPRFQTQISIHILQPKHRNFQQDAPDLLDLARNSPEHPRVTGREARRTRTAQNLAQHQIEEGEVLQLLIASTKTELKITGLF